MKALQKVSVFALAACSMLIVNNAPAQTTRSMPPTEEMTKENGDLSGFKAQDLLVVVYDMFGREIYSKVEVREDEGFLFSISSDGKKLPTGIYVITASANDRVFRQRLIVK